MVQFNEPVVPRRHMRFPPCKCPKNRGSWRAWPVAADNYHQKCSILERATSVAPVCLLGLLDTCSHRTHMNLAGSQSLVAGAGVVIALHQSRRGDHMPRFTRIAYSLAGLLVLHVLNPTVAWLVLAGGLAYMIGDWRRRTLRTATSS